MSKPRMRDLKLAPTDYAKVITKIFIRDAIVQLIRHGLPLSKHLHLWASRLVTPVGALKVLHAENSFFQDAVVDTEASLQAIVSLLGDGALAPVEKVMMSKSGSLVLVKNSILNSPHYKSLHKSFASNQAAEEQLRPEVESLREKLKDDAAGDTSAVEEALAKLHTWRDMLRPGLPTSS